MQKRAVQRALDQARLKPKDLDYICAGDLLNQCIGSSFGLREFGVPFYGLYGACSTMGEAMSLAAMAVDGGYGDRCLAMVSSHFATAEKQFRFPLGYGNQRPYSSTWTATGCGAVVLESSREKEEKDCSFTQVKISGITTGKIVDFGLKDSMNMGACMAPAAASTLEQHFIDFAGQPEEYDKIITGDLGKVGQRVLIDLLRKKT